MNATSSTDVIIPWYEEGIPWEIFQREVKTQNKLSDRKSEGTPKYRLTTSKYMAVSKE